MVEEAISQACKLVGRQNKYICLKAYILKKEICYTANISNIHLKSGEEGLAGKKEAVGR